MKNFAIIENNKIVNIIVADDAFMASQNVQSMDVTNQYAKIGMELLNGQIPTQQQVIEKAINENLPQERRANILELLLGINISPSRILTEQENADVALVCSKL
jgi:hypothetical protein